MAISVVQKYFNLALSLVASNKSGTDSYYSLPNDFRKFSDLKIKDFSTRIEDFPGHLTDEYTLGTPTTNLNPSFALYIFSHPVYLSEFADNAMASSTRTAHTSIFCVGRDRYGSLVNPELKFINKLDKTDTGNGQYTSIAGAVGNTTTVTVLEFLAEFEA